MPRFSYLNNPVRSHPDDHPDYQPPEVDDPMSPEYAEEWERLMTEPPLFPHLHGPTWLGDLWDAGIAERKNP
jgi:hypothetical protein